MKNLKAKTQKGFSLVELMVVIAIIAILAAVAIPMYSNYTTRARIGSEISKVGGVKADVSEALNHGSTLPSTLTNINRDPEIAYDANGNISISMDANGDGTADATTGPNFVRLSPTKNSGSVTWTCTGSGFTQSQLPSNCTVSGSSVAVTQMT
ncbi:pilin [Francisella uliginis]|uniref:Type IV pili fiber building block protein n=1 Tax=Francisella uliginis TaxID=573570 RepID=A0A1L4BQW5_9GAMM|nr:pilin [Francisella uliginis]API86241.1 hypothetical protein F7310_02230 [Francisella uliginis]